jgi:hypothetical protein
VRDGFTGGKTPGGLTELLGLDRAAYPAVEDLEDRWSRLETLGPHGPDGVGDYL